MKKLAMILIVGILSGCSATEYPIFKTANYNNFVPTDSPLTEARQTKSSVTITDLGRVSDQIVPLVNVQACDGSKLLVSEGTKDGKPVYNNVMENVDPFSGVYVRRVRIENDTKHSITLGTVDAILVDPNGNDNEMANANTLERLIYANRPCPSTRQLTNAFNSVAFLSNQIKVRQGRDVEVIVPFHGKSNLSIAGEWSFQLLDFPTGTDVSGAVSKRDSFMFPIIMEQTRTTIKSQKDGFFSPWVEVERNTVKID
jgi:hypothetical protein